MDQLPKYSNQEYTVGWLCALARSELTAARRMLDHQHKDPVNLNADDENSYLFGDINGHKVVITCMPPEETGTLSAQKLVQPLRRSFPNMILHLFVGIGGGIPRNPPREDPNKDIHLGDVVVGWAERAGIPAVVQYDHGRYHDEGSIELLTMLDKPNRRLLNALTPVISDREMRQTKYHYHLHRLADLAQFQYPGLENDTLFEAEYDHVAVELGTLVEPNTPHCHRCDRAHVVERALRETTDPQFHQGTILSGNMVMQNARKRDQLSKSHHDAVCIEMEAAGVTEDTHCLVIRGIADYADSHKYWSWQNYAAATAAAFARELLHKIRPVVAMTGNYEDNGLVTGQLMLRFDMAEFSRIMLQGEQHSCKPRRESITESLSAALACFSRADAMLRQSGNDDPYLQLKVYFRLMTVEFDLSHNRHWSIEERINHIRRAEEKGSMALRAALTSQKAIETAQVRLEQSFLKGRKAELEEQKGKASTRETRRVKGDALREMNEAIQKLGDLDREKYMEYVKRASSWKTRLLFDRYAFGNED